jgi:hypothetical protein
MLFCQFVINLVRTYTYFQNHWIRHTIERFKVHIQPRGAKLRFSFRLGRVKNHFLFLKKLPAMYTQAGIDLTTLDFEGRPCRQGNERFKVLFIRNTNFVTYD